MFTGGCTRQGNSSVHDYLCDCKAAYHAGPWCGHILFVSSMFDKKPLADLVKQCEKLPVIRRSGRKPNRKSCLVVYPPAKVSLDC